MDRRRFEFLITKELSDELSVQESEELAWILKNNAKFYTEYQLLKQYWNHKQSHSLRDEQLFRKVLERIGESSAPEKKRSQFRVPLVAASIALLLVSSLFFFFFFERPFNQELMTERQKRDITLEDGTQVVLNAASKLVYPETFGADKREVSLVGEAFFNVAKDRNRPFVIHTEHADLKVLGTSFNLRAYPDEHKTETSLIEGAVEVSSKNKRHKAVRLQPSEKLIIYTEPEERRHSTQVASVERSKISFFHPRDSVSVETSWLEDKLAFKDTPFGELALALERKYGVEVDFESDKARALRFNAVFENEDIRQVMTALKLAAPFKYRIIANRITIYD
ncbi:FecR family protein [Olivibacter sp. XZL3]|uniref:FecR family protein n=1 Tax=Olivibacter sp. XZL3 TaxID=1735116 RepID=UPI0010653C3C|nr:FecR domain-containing protein [Olivibacter sp. XZL3]